MDFRRQRVELAPAYISGDLVESVYPHVLGDSHLRGAVLRSDNTASGQQVSAETMFRFLCCAETVNMTLLYITSSRHQRESITSC